MKIFYILAHPRTDSLNSAFFSKGVQKLLDLQHEVQTSDLYRMNFKSSADWEDFTIGSSQSLKQYSIAQKDAFENHAFSQDIQDEQKKLLWSQLVILQFPLWWFSAPAILKGWFDRVFAKGFAYDAGKWFDTSPLMGRKALIVITTQSPSSSFSEHGLHGAIDNVLRPIYHSLRFVGFKICQPFCAFGVMNKTQDELTHTIEQYCNYLCEIEHLAVIPFPSISEFDKNLQLKNK